MLIITGCALCAALEVLTHFAIDLGKCERFYNFRIDQGLHICCKALYLVLIHLSIA